MSPFESPNHKPSIMKQTAFNRSVIACVAAHGSAAAVGANTK